MNTSHGALRGPELVVSLLNEWHCCFSVSLSIQHEHSMECHVRDTGKREENRRKQKERQSERTPVSADLIRYHNLTKQSLLIYTNTPRQFLQIPPTLPNATVKKYVNPQTRGDSVIILIMLFFVSFPPAESQQRRA